MASSLVMADAARIPTLIDLGKTRQGIAAAQARATLALGGREGDPLPPNACAATLSAFLNMAGVGVPMTLGAGKLAWRLEDGRSWQKVVVGFQKPGDIGVTFDDTHPPGADHVYLVLETLGADRMTIADNQASMPHLRYASGHGRTQTDYFLRAPGA